MHLMTSPASSLKLDSILRIGFELTNVCELHCKICTIWQEKNKKFLLLSDIKKVMASTPSPCYVSLTGGEPLLHPDFYEIYDYFHGLYLQDKISGINISTNAYSENIILFLKKFKTKLKPLSINISLDGLSRTHNAQRGTSDAFKNTIKNILLIKKFHTPLLIKCILTNLNCSDFFNLYLLIKKINCNLKVNLYTKNINYYNRHKTKNNNLTISSSQKNLLLKIIKKIMAREKSTQTNSSLILSLLHLQWLLTGVNTLKIKKIYKEKKFYNSIFITSGKKIYNNIYCPAIGFISGKKAVINWGKIEKIKQKALKNKNTKYLSPFSYLRQI